MASHDLVELTADLTVETLASLRHVLAQPSLAHSYFHVCGLPPLAIPPSFSHEVDTLVANRNTAGAAATQREAARIMTSIVPASPAALGSPWGTSATEITHRLLLPLLLELLRRKWPKVYLGVAALLFLDEKVREWYPGHIGKHWSGAFADFWKQYRGDPQVTRGQAWPLYVAHGALVGAGIAEHFAGEGIGETLGDRFRFALGYDHPPHGIDGEVLEILQRAVSVSWRRFEDRSFGRSEYDAFGPLYAEQRQQIGFTVVPVPGQRDNGALVRQAAMLLQLDYEHTEKVWDEWRGTIGGSGKTLYVCWPEVDVVGGTDLRASLQRVVGSEGHTLGVNDHRGTYGLTITGVEIGGFARRGIGAGLFARLRGAALEVKPPADDKVLGTLLPGGFTLPINTGIRLDKDGLHWEGPDGFTDAERPADPAPAALARGVPATPAPRALAPRNAVTAASTPTSVSRSIAIPINRTIGAGGYGLRLNQIDLSATYRTHADGHDVEAAATASLTLALGPVTGVIEGIGAALIARRSEDTTANNVAGVASVDWAFVPPTGIGILVDAKVIKGGGFLRLDRASGRYAGALELAIGKRFTLKGVGLIEPTAAGKTSMVMLASLQVPPSSPSFSVTGVGAFLGVHRRGAVDEFRTALTTGELADVLFPDDPVGRATQILGTLGRFFPSADGRHIVGLLFQIVFGGQTKLITASLGALVEVGASWSDTQVYLLLQGRLELPGALKKSFQINVDGIGHWDVGRGEFELRLKLRDSKLFGADLTGEGLVLSYRVPSDTPELPSGDVFADAQSGRKQLFVSLGGYHPLYRPPARARVDQRLGLVIKKGDWLRFEVQQYVALTPGAFHLGADAELMLKFWELELRGGFGFDAVVGFDWSFDIGIRASLAVKFRGRTLTAVRVDMQLRGPGPTTLSGRVKLSILWFDIDKSFHKELSSTPATPQPAPDLLAMLEASIRRPDSWSRAPVDGVAITKRDRADRIWASPTRPLRMQQSVVPLGVSVDRYGPGRLAQPTTFAIPTVSINGSAPARVPIRGEFARALYVDLSEEEALVAEGFEDLEAGFEIEPNALDLGAVRISADDHEDIQIPAPAAIRAPGADDEILFDPAAAEPPRPPPPAPPPLVSIAPRRFGVHRGREVFERGVPYIVAREQARKLQPSGGANAHVVRADEIRKAP